MTRQEFIVDTDARILITGASGFIGINVVGNLLKRGFRNLRCFARPTAAVGKLEALGGQYGLETIQIMRGNLQSPEDCMAAAKGVDLIIHLAAGRGEKSFPDAFMNSVVTTRNLLEGALTNGRVLRFVNISSFAVYSNRGKSKGRLLDETCPVESRPHIRGEAYCFAKVKQDEVVKEYAEKKNGIPCVTVRPGYVIGPGNPGITGRVGIEAFGPFLHLGGGNRIPFTFVENCADAIVLAGLQQGIDGEVFNIVDDELPTSRQFLRLYKKRVRAFRSLYIPHPISYALCYCWQRYSAWSQEQLPPAFNSSRWHANWKKTNYSNAKAKAMLGWSPKISMSEGLERYFEGCRQGKQQHA